MPDIEMPDPEELGGNVTKPFKFVTGSCLSVVQIGPLTLLTVVHQLVREL
jgi:hypothetical protein